MTNIAVLGAGIAGISASYHSKELGAEAIIYEASDKIGGLISNFSPIEGFRFDNAIHMSFTKDEYVKGLFNKTAHYKHIPNAYCLEDGTWLKHPVQNNLAPLQTEKKVRLIKSFVDRPNKLPTNYEEWLYHQYGAEISETYPIPYTKKYWGLLPSQLSLEWIGSRMRRADISEILSGAFEQKNINHYYAGEMRYPEKGGYFEFVRSIADNQNIKLNKKAVSVDTASKTISFEDGTKAAFDRLISSLPLPTIVNILKDCPATVLKAANSLLWTTVDLISVGFNKKEVPPYLWFYIYDDDNMASRAYSPSMKSPDNAPAGKSSLQFEIYNLSSKARLEPEILKENIRIRLLEMGICEEEDIIFIHHKHLPFGNVVFDHGMEDRRQIVLDYLSSIGIQSCGRFGEWDYFWSDQSFMSGRRAAHDI